MQLEGLAAERLTVFPSGLAILIAIFETLDIESMTLAGGALDVYKRQPLVSHLI